MFKLKPINSRGQGALEVLIIMGILIIAAIIFSLIYVGSLKNKDSSEESQNKLISDFNSTMHTYELPAESGFNFNLESDSVTYMSFIFLLFLIIKTIQLSPIFKINNQKVI